MLINWLYLKSFFIKTFSSNESQIIFFDFSFEITFPFTWPRCIERFLISFVDFNPLFNIPTQVSTQKYATRTGIGTELNSENSTTENSSLYFENIETIWFETIPAYLEIFAIRGEILESRDFFLISRS